MKNTELVKRAKEIATQRDTLYLGGQSGEAITESIKERHRFEYHHGRKRTILEAADNTTYAFGNTGYITAILKGWNPDTKKSKVKAKGLPRKLNEMTALDYINACKNVSAEFDYIEPGELLWTDGCIGLYIGDGLCALCSESWNDGVQIVGVVHRNEDYNIPNMRWKKHGKLPWIEYEYGKHKTYVVVAAEVLAGDWGLNRKEIEARLKEKGYNERLVMKRVDEHIAEHKQKTLKQIAAGVIIGKWGRTPEEQARRLTVAGYDVKTIRHIVNRIMKGESV